MIYINVLSALTASDEFFSKDGKLYLNDNEISIKGSSWFGFEGELACLHGLHLTAMTDVLDFAKENKINALRVPLSAELVMALDTTPCQAVDSDASLSGKSAGFALDMLFKECEKRGILIMLDMHYITLASKLSTLWYVPDTEYDEGYLISAWEALATRYGNAPNFLSADIKNEPHEEATWGGDESTDWAAASVRIANAFHKIAPKPLIFIQGIQYYKTFGGWWGGNLIGVKDLPLSLEQDNKLVYSPHVFGPSLDREFISTETSTKEFERDFGYIDTDKLGTVVIGEFGGTFQSSTKDDQWHEAIGEYITSKNLSFFYWCINPDSSDTGGLLEDDWKTPVTIKLDYLEKISPNPTDFTSDSPGTPEEENPEEKNPEEENPEEEIPEEENPEEENPEEENPNTKPDPAPGVLPPDTEPATGTVGPSPGSPSRPRCKK